MSANPTINEPDKTRSSKRLLLVAIILGLLAAIINYASAANTSSLTVLKAKALILAGTPVSESLFDKVTISGNIKEMRSLVVANDDFQKAFNGRPVTNTLDAGQLLLLRSFDLSGGEVRESIRQGQRAISIDVPDEAQGVAYFIRPGDSVDVWGSINGAAYRLKEGACVRAVGEGASGPGRVIAGAKQYRTVTIVVPEADVEGLVANLAYAGDSVRLTLIGPCDPKNEAPAMRPITLPGNPAAGPQAAAPQAIRTAPAPTPTPSVAPVVPEPTPPTSPSAQMPMQRRP
jgi:Flp pilus assembly protein CpaB